MLPASPAAEIICCLGSSSAPAPPAFCGGSHQRARRILFGRGHAVLEIELDAIGTARVRLVDVLLHVHRHVEQRAPDRQIGFPSASSLVCGGVSQTTPSFS